ncbi:MAG: hypothetical protein JWP82_3023 [Humibacillus sp.]|nr:hypothetical protein [Humibacillus sp.]
MKLYADTPARRTRQILADAFVLLWVGTWVWVGRWVHDVVAELRAPGESLASAGASVRGGLTSAGEQAGQLPLVGDRVREIFTSAAGSGTSLENAGRSLSDTVETLARTLGFTTALVPIVLVVATWAALRLRFARQATSAQRFIDTSADLDLFALRALSRQPMTALARISDDPAGAWRRRDPEVVHQLALLELRDSGLRPPPRP